MPAETQNSIKVNNTSYTKVLDVAGFCYSEDNIYYVFSSTQPANDKKGIMIEGCNQMGNLEGAILWAKSISSYSYVIPTIYTEN